MAAVIADSAKRKRCTYPSEVGTGRDPFESAAISQRIALVTAINAHSAGKSYTLNRNSTTSPSAIT